MIVRISELGEVRVGLLFFNHDTPGMAAFIDGWFSLRGKSYDAVWDQVQNGGYAECRIDIGLGPLLSEPPNFVWEVSRPVFILTASVRFTRKPSPQDQAKQATRRKGLFTRR
jgi:hypothetical protein